MKGTKDRPIIYSPRQFNQLFKDDGVLINVRVGADVDYLKSRIDKLKEILTEEYGECGDCVDAKVEGFTVCGDCSLRD